MADFFSLLQNFSNSIVNFTYINLSVFRFFSIVISAFFLAIIIYLNIILNLTGEKIEHWIDVVGSENISKRRSIKAWKQIQKRLKIGNQIQLKLAILEADRVLEEMFKLAGYPGRNMDERLVQLTSAELSNIEDIRQVHQIRHRIVREPDFSLTLAEAKQALQVYKKAFIEFGLISKD